MQHEYSKKECNDGKNSAWFLCGIFVWLVVLGPCYSFMSWIRDGRDLQTFGIIFLRVNLTVMPPLPAPSYHFILRDSYPLSFNTVFSIFLSPFPTFLSYQHIENIRKKERKDLLRLILQMPFCILCVRFWEANLSIFFIISYLVCT